MNSVSYFRDQSHLFVSSLKKQLLTNQPTFQKTCLTVCTLTVEMTKLVSAAVFLNYMQIFFLLPAVKPTRYPISFAQRSLFPFVNRLSKQDIFLHVVERPLIEEIIFRGFLLRGIQGLQIGWNRLNSEKKISREELLKQKIIRIIVSACLWVGCHWRSYSSDPNHRLIQISCLSLNGISYGYLSENYHTLSISILAHGINNALCVGSELYPQNSLLQPAIFIHQILLFSYVALRCFRADFKGREEINGYK